MQSVEVAQASVALAEQLVKDNQTRVEIGTMAPIDVVQAQSQAATQRQNLATAEGTRRTAELALKRLIVAGTQDPNWIAALDPVDRPDFVPHADRRRGGGPPCAREPNRPAAGAEEPAGQRRHAEVPEQPDAAAGRPGRALRPDRSGRHAVHHCIGQRHQPVVHRRRFPAATRRAQLAVRPRTTRRGTCR